MQRRRGREDARRGPRIGVFDIGTVAAIVPAGGSSRRLAGDGPPKQFRPLAGRTLIEWSVDLLSEAGCAPVIVAVPAPFLSDTRSLLGDRGVAVLGGSTRQASVALALEEVETERVVVHDAARPFASVDLVRGVVGALDEAQGAVAAIPVENTLKEAEDGVVLRTIDRSRVWQVQTPQAFDTATLRAAHESADPGGLPATDDAMLVEALGAKVAVVLGSRSNIKVTYPEDFALAEAMIPALRP